MSELGTEIICAPMAMPDDFGPPRWYVVGEDENGYYLEHPESGKHTYIDDLPEGEEKGQRGFAEKIIESQRKNGEDFANEAPDKAAEYNENSVGYFKTIEDNQLWAQRGELSENYFKLRAQQLDLENIEEKRKAALEEIEELETRQAELEDLISLEEAREAEILLEIDNVNKKIDDLEQEVIRLENQLNNISNNVSSIKATQSIIAENAMTIGAAYQKLQSGEYSFEQFYAEIPEAIRPTDRNAPEVVGFESGMAKYWEETQNLEAVKDDTAVLDEVLSQYDSRHEFLANNINARTFFDSSVTDTDGNLVYHDKDEGLYKLATNENGEIIKDDDTGHPVREYYTDPEIVSSLMRQAWNKDNPVAFANENFMQNKDTANRAVSTLLTDLNTAQDRAEAGRNLQQQEQEVQNAATKATMAAADENMPEGRIDAPDLKASFEGAADNVTEAAHNALERGRDLADRAANMFFGNSGA